MPLTLSILIFIGLLLLIPTAYAAKIGAPYAPTFSPAIRQAFDYIKLGPQDTIIDLGAGDGRVLLAASKRGAHAIGYELSPIMLAVAWLRSIGKPNIKLHMVNFYKKKLPSEITVIFAFLMPENMNKVKQCLAQQNLPNIRHVLIYAFPFKDVKPLHVVRAPKCCPLYIYDFKEITDKA